MPICYRCGKHLTTEQGLQYHLSKKVQCNTLSCDICDKRFENKTLLRNHQILCKSKCVEVNDIAKIRHLTYDTLQSANSFILELNNKFQIQYISADLCAKLGYHKTDVIGYTYLNILHETDVRKVVDTFESTKKSVYFKHNTNNIHVNADITYMNSYITIIETITYKNECENLRIKLEQQEQVYNCLLHEIKNPLNAICNGFDVIKLREKCDKPYDNSNICEMQYVTSNMIRNILNDFRDFSNDCISIQPSNISINVLLNEIKEYIHPMEVLFEKHINFSEMKHNISIYCDPLKLKQVLINILQNGIQYSNSNEISFRYFATHYSINFEISHKTAKIYNNLDTIFDINERCNDMTNNEGSGLGLFIAKELAKKLGGTLNVHQDNNMINFIVELKLEPQQECTIVPKTVLYVDDFFGFKCTQLLLEMHGMDTTHVSSGEEAIELCKTENTFDIVLVDKNMKGIDGIETIQQLRKCNMNKNATYFGFTGELTNAFEEINVQTLMKPLNIENFKSIVFN